MIRISSPTPDTSDQSSVASKARSVFSDKPKLPSKKDKMILTTFSIEPEFKDELNDLFNSMGLRWASGIRFALKEYQKKYQGE